jgi:hypothetical protein
MVERIQYAARWPWPTNAFGTGLSLQRIDPVQYGNDPANWRATTPTAGSANSAVPADADTDGLPDYWEWVHFAGLANDGWGDSDADGFRDRDEYRAGTDPLDASSALVAGVIHSPTGNRGIVFTAVVGRNYAVQYRDDLTVETWLTLAEVGPLTATQSVTVDDPGIAHARFYRVGLP